MEKARRKKGEFILAQAHNKTNKMELSELYRTIDTAMKRSLYIVFIITLLSSCRGSQPGAAPSPYQRKPIAEVSAAELSADSAAVGDAKWGEREVEYGNLSAALHAYKEAVFYLDTVNPKPDGYPGLKEKLEQTEAELSKRYNDQRFLANKAMNLADWETAQAELKILCEMVPDKDDPRHAEANAKLVDVENRMKKAKGGR